MKYFLNSGQLNSVCQLSGRGRVAQRLHRSMLKFANVSYPKVNPKDFLRDDTQEESAMMWPYRTTPLVLPGAKVKREPPTESYLRHHPNPSFRAPPHHTPDYLLKQKVASSVLERVSSGDPSKQLVHKQFNSPINLYSEPNVIDTIHKQTGVKPQIKRKVQFNPAESETYRAIQEEQLGEHVHEVTVPPQSRIYAPNKSIPPKKTGHHVVNQNPYPNTITGADPDQIQQSGSFRRLMMSVLPSSSY
ncbi:unnamed protein product [Acanthoscelides obtectus]|uniref:Zasp-like motif domain-containing protein n=1 Tax=Acanthoscelides obtectus TaxID=200917 RepID=A0A9P0P8L9_ACAOB|nr:unnamed protein product [Acanthoscelides obtectus]CAK1654515.1 hypothetical protein AOBTE_LOCUS18651 [Acanthoscelides obtectus]